MQVRIKNSQITEFGQFLLTLELKGKKSRLRTRFIKLLNEQLRQFNEEHTLLLKEHCHLDEEGNPKTVERDNKQYWDIKDIPSYKQDYNELLEEEFIIEGEDKRDMLLAVKVAVLDCEKSFSGNEAMLYDQWCDIVENIEE